MQVIGFDCETAYDAEGVDREYDPVVCLTLASVSPLPITGGLPGDNALYVERNGCYCALLTGDLVSNAWEALLNDPNVLLVAHSAAFDVCNLGHESSLWLKGFLAADEGRIRCTRVREKLIAIALDTVGFDPRLGRPPQFRLYELVQAYFGQDISASKGADTWRTRYRLLDGVPLEYWPKAAVDYAIDDAVWALLCYGVPEDMTIAETGIPLIHDGTVTNEIEQVCSDIDLYATGRHGVMVHRARAEQFKRNATVVFKQGLAAGKLLGFVRDDGTRDMKKLAVLIKEHIPNPALTNTGRVATHKKQLAALEEYLPDLKVYNNGRAVEKDVTTYAPKLAGDIIRTRYDILKRTGRTSADIQQPPRVAGFRECHIARPGMVFSFCDYESIELVTWAQVCIWWFGNSKMADMINEGIDPHVNFAAFLLGDSYDDAYAAYKAKDPRYHGPMAARQLAKIGNYGLLGGMGPGTFVSNAANYGITISKEPVLDPFDPLANLPSAREVYDGFRQILPEAPLYFNRMSYATMGRSTFTAVQAVSLRQRGGVGYMDGCNTYFQGLAADGWKAAAWQLRIASVTPSSPLYGVKAWLALHDETALEGPEETAHLWAPEQARIMAKAMQKYCPDVKVRCSYVISRCWSKDAEPVYDEDTGEMIPWDVQ